MYTRAETLYDIRLLNQYEDDMVDYCNGEIHGNSGKVTAWLEHGLTAKIGIGYKF